MIYIFFIIFLFVITFLMCYIIDIGVRKLNTYFYIRLFRNKFDEIDKETAKIIFNEKISINDRVNELIKLSELRKIKQLQQNRINKLNKLYNGKH